MEEREAQLRVNEEEIKQRDAEINKLMGELRRCQELLRQVSHARKHIEITFTGTLLINLPLNLQLHG